MGNPRDSNGLVVLDRDACLRMLATRRVASVAITDGALPLVLPAMYLLHGDEIYVAADRHGILGRRLPENIVSLCVHDIADDFGTGWNVTVTSQARLVDDDEAPPTLECALPLWRRASKRGEGHVVVKLGTERIAGRQILA